ncbi:MAG TPA: hypothetical protein VJZ71_17290 [Phycisphaerae bacterium]|nr:hypothetical protein [Phycisphaerae bacterium]
MKLRCPRCKQKLNVPEKLGGKTIRCPSCNRAFTVPVAQAGSGAALDASRMDLEGLANLEKQSSGMSDADLSEVLAAEAQKKKAAPADSKMRACPNCGKEMRIVDPYVEILCSHCWNPIPALVQGSSATTTIRGGKGRRKSTEGAAGFYGDLANCVAYPLPALGSLLTASGLAVAAGLLPVAAMTAMANLMQQGAVGTDQGVQKADLSNVQLILIGIFAAEVFFFTAIAIHAFIDVIKTTTTGTDAPPNLSWGPSAWGKSFLGYVTLVAYAVVMTYVVLLLTVGDPWEMIRAGRVVEMFKSGGTALIVGMVVVSFGIPMNLLGFALGNIGQALNPVNVVKSIGRTHAHYAFLVVLLSVYGALFGAAFMAIVFDWLIPQIGKMRAGSAEGDLVQVALALLTWGAVMLFYFYGTYVLARMHGLFARSFRKDLFFGTG